MTSLTIFPKGTPLALLTDGADNGTFVLPPDTGAGILTVGVGMEYATLSAAIAASVDGDIIQVNAGTYYDDTAAVWHAITIIGVGGMVNLVATKPLANQKGILIANRDLTVENVSFRGAWVDDGSGANAAGIRYQGGNLVLINDFFTNNQDGVMGSPSMGLPSNTITVDHCTFDGNGNGNSASIGYGYTHNIYASYNVEKLTVTNSVFENVVGAGHEIKSRAYSTSISNSVISDGAATASYSIDIPNGGVATVTGNYIEKGVNAQNHSTIHFGGEGFPYATSSLTISGNTVVNDLGTAANFLLNQTLIPVTVTGNTLVNFSAAQIASGPVKATNNVNGAGVLFPDSTAAQLFPANTTIFTDALPHTIAITANNTGVIGGAGLLTVDATAGNLVIAGGSGGLIYREHLPAGSTMISTAAGSTNSISVVGGDVISSQGTDTISVGPASVHASVTGTANVTSGPGHNIYQVSGMMNLIGGGGSDYVSVANGALVHVTGSSYYDQINSVGGVFTVDATVAGEHEQASVVGGTVGLVAGGGAMSFITYGGTGQGAVITLGAGTVSLQSHAADTIYAGSGSDLLQIGGGGQTVYAGTGSLIVAVTGIVAGSGTVFYGAGGDYVIRGDSGNLTYMGGALASTVEAKVAYLNLVGGAGHLTVNGSGRSTITGGRGGLTLNGGAADVVTTAAGSVNAISLIGGSTIFSNGTDTIDAGSTSQTITVTGFAQITNASGTDRISVLGGANITATGGYETITFGQGASGTVRTAAVTTLTETGGQVGYTAVSAAGNASVAVDGNGAATITSGGVKPLTVQTVAGLSTFVVAGVGTVNVVSAGADTIYAGSGLDTVSVSGNGAMVTGGAGTLTVTGLDANGADNITVRGGAGAVTMNSGGKSGMTFIGGSGSAVVNGGQGALVVTGGAGSLSVTQGWGVLSFQAGAGNASVAIGPAAAEITFGPGTTTVSRLVAYGTADTFNFGAASAGGFDVINGFRGGVDRLAFQGASVASVQTGNGSTWLMLSNAAQVELVGVTGFHP
ncbi:MAG: hypothetical protein KGL35_27415 [Bradyrhizobium sp.]|nr:hypothetical protein [Bradyrhizobium sp.]